MRGGAEASQLFEWGGLNATLIKTYPYYNQLNPDTNYFYTKRSLSAGWTMPIHNLLKTYQVTAVFHGHDHVYVKEIRDGIIYQEVPQPSAGNTASGCSLATSYGYIDSTASGTTAGACKSTTPTPPYNAYGAIVDSSSGYLRVTVSPTQVKSEYIRSWMPSTTPSTISKNIETGTKKNKQVSQTWTCTYQATTGLCT